MLSSPSDGYGAVPPLDPHAKSSQYDQKNPFIDSSSLPAVKLVSVSVSIQKFTFYSYPHCIILSEDTIERGSMQFLPCRHTIDSKQKCLTTEIMCYYTVFIFSVIHIWF